MLDHSFTSQQGLCCFLHSHNHLVLVSSVLAAFVCCFPPATSFIALVWLVFLNFPFMLEPAPIDGNSPTSPCLHVWGVPQISPSLLAAQPVCKQEGPLRATCLGRKKISCSRVSCSPCGNFRHTQSSVIIISSGVNCHVAWKPFLYRIF